MCCVTEYRNYSTMMWAVCPVLSRLLTATEPHAMKPTGWARHGVVTPPPWGLDLSHRYWLRGRA